jgi:hypothetical protein
MSISDYIWTHIFGWIGHSLQPAERLCDRHIVSLCAERIEYFTELAA